MMNVLEVEDSRMRTRATLISDVTKAVTLFGIATALFLSPIRVLSQESGGAIRENALRVFLDCSAFQCDSDYFRTEISFVNWVRDRTLAQVHLIVTSTSTGGGGSAFTLDFIGQEELAGDDDRLPLLTLATDSEDEVLSTLTNVIGAGLARYSAAIGQPTAFAVESSEEMEEDSDGIVGSGQVNDPWNFWVFEVSGEAEIDGEDTEKESGYSGSFEASRTTDTWKFEFEADGSSSRNERELSDGDLSVDERTNWGVDLFLIRALAPHWSAGIFTGAGASTSRNQEVGADEAVAVEYSFFPYAEAPRQSLTARYTLRMQHFDWEEETIYFETEETRPQHEIRLELFQRQPWGESSLGLDGSQYLHATDLWSVSLFGELEFRIARGLNLELSGQLAFIEDQIYLSREGLTDEEILLGRFDRPTDRSYSLGVGLSYEFGSIFNNVVNNRFDSRDFR
jgi:hypothetical protein